MKKIFSSFILAFLCQFSFAQIPAGYYNGTTGLSGAALKTKLFQIISTGTVDNGYGGLWTAYQTTDKDNFYENDNTVLDIYSENPNGPDPYNYNFGTGQCGNVGAEGTCYNREHVVPQSLFNSVAPMVSDIHFIRPTDGKVNGARSNYPFGNVGTATFTSLNGSKVGNSTSLGYGGTVFEPNSAFKGDIARMVLYFVTRYETQLSGFSTGNLLGGSSFPGLQAWELQQMLIWNAQDPVSAEEIARNNASYTYQGNRNPFIDNNQYVTDIWGSVVVDTTPPTVPTNLAASNPTSNTIDLAWTPSTDNVGVSGYDVYVNGIGTTTVSGTTATISNLSPSTTYNFYLKARDLAGNTSAQSNTATETTLAGAPAGTSCGAEDFENIPTSASNYDTRTWTNNFINWTATDARTDQPLNGRAITIRNGTLSSSSIGGGIKKITISTKLIYGSVAGTFTVRINGTSVGTVPYSTSTGTFSIDNINVTGSFTLSLTDNSVTGNRVAFDDITWECYSLSTSEIEAGNQFQIYPNPVIDGKLNVKGENLNKIKFAEIYDTNGKLIQKISAPFEKSTSIILNKIPTGLYILKTSEFSTKFIVK
ncbi:endonuclease [Frigoriflavimonas asaccharolytica]|uniref:Endonuclease I/chitodextrinase n=1 Tax=Frigoriflavimonas asaccharolytica TaxID=2735899 RepID=A0A8J8GAM4_9FLAO|nr:endonuclease [Frigoriflavimonas asaccharolytica]NRS92455.1 endonuclease I/chitodextrinase [Frigoriflavimonas asaccharolytica]